jgi:RNA polymerase primary sigma factor
MMKVLGDVKDMEEVLSGDEGLRLADEEISEEEEEIPEVGGVPLKREFELGEGSLSLYLGEVGQTPLLDAEEEKLLGSQIEKGKHLARLEDDWVAKYDDQPSPIDLVLALAEDFSRARLFFEALYQYLGLPSKGSMAEKVLHPDLRRAIDGHIDQHLSSAIAQATGASQTGTEQALIQLSLDSGLIPWHIIEGAGQGSSVAEFGELLRSLEFRNELEDHSSEIARHFEQIRERADQATKHMIQANLRMVISVAKGHNDRGVPLSDLIQEGNIGLMQAVQRFDHRRGYKFSTYAIPWIWQAVNRSVNDQSRIVRLPGHLVDNLKKLAQARNRLSQKVGRQPTERELASEMGISPEKVEWLLKVSSGGPVSLETPIGEEGSQLGDFIGDRAIPEPEEEADASLLKEQLSEALESLTPREQRIIELRFGLGSEYSRTLEEVGTELGLTKERIRQIEKEALAKLRHPSRSRKLIGYLG